VGERSVVLPSIAHSGGLHHLPQSLRCRSQLQGFLPGIERLSGAWKISNRVGCTYVLGEFRVDPDQGGASTVLGRERAIIDAEATEQDLILVFRERAL
jgi:hypothetical protein